MHPQSSSRSPITITTSPIDPPSRRPSSYSGPVQYRIEERRRTVYVTSTLQPGELDLEEILKLADISESEQEVDPNTGATHVVRRSKSMTDREVLVFEDSPNQMRYTNSPTASHRSRTHRPPRGEAHLGVPSPWNTPPTSPIRGSYSPTYTRPRILFYHRHDPHYGFTNFSAHPVIYNGRRYPTSEHLFQSFKVEYFLVPRPWHGANMTATSLNTALILLNTFERALNDPASHFPKLVGLLPKFVRIGCE